MEVKEFLDILHTAERLKDTLRHCTTSQRRTESVAEHSWRAALMALLLKDEFPEINTDKVIKMCIVHDLGECFTGDIPTFEKTAAHRKTEDTLMEKWISELPAETAEQFRELFTEMASQKTPESRLFKAIDKLEALIQHNESPIDTWSANEYELNRTYAFDTVDFSPWLKALRNEILSQTIEKIENE